MLGEEGWGWRDARCICGGGGGVGCSQEQTIGETGESVHCFPAHPLPTAYDHPGGGEDVQRPGRTRKVKFTAKDNSTGLS